MKSTLPLVLLGWISAASASPPTSVKPSDLVGAWRCGPYVMKGHGITVTATEDLTRSEAGTFTSQSTTLIEAPGRVPLTIKERSEGTWVLSAGIVSDKTNRSEFLSASDPSVTKEAGQKALDEQLKKKSISESRIIEYIRTRYRTIPVHSIYKEAEVEVNCERT